MFRHGYIFHDMLAEIGPLNDGKVRTHRSLQLIFGVNKTFRIRLQGEWQSARLCLIDGNIEHFISGEDDWQICFFIYPDTHLGNLLKSKILKDSSVSILTYDENPGTIRTEQAVTRPMSLKDLRGLLERFIYIFTEKRAFPRSGLDVSLKLINLMNGASGHGLSLSDASSILDIPQDDLILDFKRETEMDVRSWLLHLRMIRFFNALESLDRIPDMPELDDMARFWGISGVSGLDRLFEDFFGMPYVRWINRELGTVILTEQSPSFVVYS